MNGSRSAPPRGFTYAPPDPDAIEPPASLDVADLVAWSERTGLPLVERDQRPEAPP